VQEAEGGRDDDFGATAAAERAKRRQERLLLSSPHIYRGRGPEGGEGGVSSKEGRG